MKPDRFFTFDIHILCTILVIGLCGVALAQSSVATIDIHADKTLFRSTDTMNGANLEDLNYQMTGGIYSQLLFGESFQEQPLDCSTGKPVASFTAYGGAWTVAADGSLAGGEDGLLVADGSEMAIGEAGVEIRAGDKQSAASLLFGVEPSAKWPTAKDFHAYEVAISGGGAVTLFKHEYRAATKLGTINSPVAKGGWTAVGVRFDRKTIQVSLDGKQVIDVDLSQLPVRGDVVRAVKPGRVGVRLNGGAGQFRNLWIKSGDPRRELPFKRATQPSQSGEQISGQWAKVIGGSAKGEFALPVEGGWYAGKVSQQVTFASGEGEVGLDNAGLNRWGINLVAGKPYEGLLRIKTPQAAEVWVSLRSADGTRVLAEKMLQTKGDAREYQRFEFSLTPSGDDTKGRFAVTLRRPGVMTLGYAFLQAGEWGRFKGLPVRKDLAEAVMAQGVKVIRFNGGMVQRPDFRLKNQIIPRDQRPPYDGFYYAYAGQGWSILEFVAFCEASGVTAIPGIDVGEDVTDLANLIEYLNGSADSTWGKKRVADGHPAPYGLKYIQIGNEQGLNGAYVGHFKRLSAAVWSKDPGIIPVTACNPVKKPEAIEINRYAQQHGTGVVWDYHLFAGRADKASKALATLPGIYAWMMEQAPECKTMRFAVLEFNAGYIDFGRGLASAAAMNATQRMGDFVIATATPNVFQSWEQVAPDWKSHIWVQANIYYTPDKVWYQPGFYVAQMVARNPAPNVVNCEAPEPLNVYAGKSDDGKHLVLRVVNIGTEPITATIKLTGFAPGKPTAHVEELTGAIEAFNSLQEPEKIKPVITSWPLEFKEGTVTRTFGGSSFTVIRFE